MGTVFGVLDVVPRTVLTIQVVHITVDAVFDTFLLPELRNILHCAERTQTKFCKFLLVFLLRVLLIQNVILFVSEIGREEAVLATLEVIAECAVAAVIEVL